MLYMVDKVLKSEGRAGLRSQTSYVLRERI